MHSKSSILATAGCGSSSVTLPVRVLAFMAAIAQTKAKGGGMPKTSRYPMTELPGTLQRSPTWR